MRQAGVRKETVGIAVMCEVYCLKICLLCGRTYSLRGYAKIQVEDSSKALRNFLSVKAEAVIRRGLTLNEEPGLLPLTYIVKIQV